MHANRSPRPADTAAMPPAAPRTPQPSSRIAPAGDAPERRPRDRTDIVTADEFWGRLGL